ncbi:MAG: 4-hydroxy-tetrahydrodipicolinate reductase [Alphaproteobacteria bacterium GM202ARS2]|nr:4-hydroxy-tetrahydrodipicolinate reductase [Alphaproteobacteria bacterium GM202ARS2]
MGSALVLAVMGNEQLQLSGALERPQHPLLQRDIASHVGLNDCGVKVSDDIHAVVAEADVVIDFSSPEHSVALSLVAAELGKIHVIGTTGFSDEDEATLQKAAASCVIVKSANMSVGVNVMRVLTQKAAAILAADFDVEILDVHHRRKVDAPSGTSLALAESVARGRGVATDKALDAGFRWGHTQARELGRVGFGSLRGGDVVGTHSVLFLGNGETFEMTHRAQDRSIYAQGAVQAALWAQGKPHGLYDMVDVFQGILADCD